MSDWCRSHPRYEAKRKPLSLCGQCWKLYFLRNPEKKVVVQESRHTTERVYSMSKRQVIPVAHPSLLLSLMTDQKTKEPYLAIKVGDFTEIGLSLDAASALAASIERFQELYREHHYRAVAKAKTAAANNKAQPSTR